MWCLEIGYGDNQAGAEFLHFMKVKLSLHYVNAKSSHVWNMFYLQEFIELWHDNFSP